jgi:hypothetical protein
MPCQSQSSLFDHPNIWWGVQGTKPLIMQSSPLPCHLIPLGPKYPPQHIILQSLHSSLNVSDQVSHPQKTTGKIIALCIWMGVFKRHTLKETQTTPRIFLSNPFPFTIHCRHKIRPHAVWIPCSVVKCTSIRKFSPPSFYLKIYFHWSALLFYDSLSTVLFMSFRFVDSWIIYQHWLCRHDCVTAPSQVSVQTRTLQFKV